MNNGSVKNFLSGSLAEQSDYFDELANIAHYPGNISLQSYLWGPCWKRHY